MKSHLSITQAGLTSLLVTLVGQLVAFIPAFAADKADLISAGSTAIAAAFLIANAVHKLADSHVSASDVKAGAIDAARAELAKVDFTGLVHDAVDTKSLPDLEAMVKAEVQRITSGLFAHLASVPTAADPVLHDQEGDFSPPVALPPTAA